MMLEFRYHMKRRKVTYFFLLKFYFLNLIYYVALMFPSKNCKKLLSLMYKPRKEYFEETLNDNICHISSLRFDKWSWMALILSQFTNRIGTSFICSRYLENYLWPFFSETVRTEAILLSMTEIAFKYEYRILSFAFFKTEFWRMNRLHSIFTLPCLLLSFFFKNVICFLHSCMSL